MPDVYGIGLYDSAVYAALPTKFWEVLVKWDGTNEIDEAPQLMEIQTFRGRKKMLRGAEGFEPQDIGEAILVFRNMNGRYDPLNASSPLYPNVAPGKVVTLRLTDAEGPTYGIFKGHISDLRPFGSAHANKVRMTVRDGWQWLKDRNVRAAAAAGKGTAAAITDILTAAEYPFTQDVTSGADVIPYWWADNGNAKGLLQDLVDSEFGWMWAGVDGAFSFRPRWYQYLVSSSATLNATEINEIAFAQPWDVVRNFIQIKVYPSEIIANAVDGNAWLWRTKRPIKLAPTQIITLTVKYKYRGQPTSAMSVSAPQAINDYLCYANADGTGDDLTTALTISSFASKGTEAEMTLVNDHPSRAIYITTMTVHGSVILQGEDLIVEKDTSGAAARRAWLLDVPWQQDAERGQMYADYLSTFLANPRAQPIVKTNRSMAKQCIELNTVQTLNFSTLGINKKYRVGGIAQQWNVQRLNVLDTTLYYESIDEKSYWILGTSALNTSAALAY